MADEIVYVTVTADVVEIVEVESLTPEPVIVNVYLNDGTPGSGSDGYSFVQDTQPTATTPGGQTWFNTSNGASYVFFDSFWVQTSPGQGSSSDGAHLSDPTPHPVYDDLASLTLLYENQIV